MYIPADSSATMGSTPSTSRLVFTITNVYARLTSSYLSMAPNTNYGVGFSWTCVKVLKFIGISLENPNLKEIKMRNGIILILG